MAEQRAGPAILDRPGAVAEAGPVLDEMRDDARGILRRRRRAHLAAGHVAHRLRVGADRRIGGDVGLDEGAQPQPRRLDDHRSRAATRATSASRSARMPAPRDFAAATTAAGAVSGEPASKGGAGAYSICSWMA